MTKRRRKRIGKLIRKLEAVRDEIEVLQYAEEKEADDYGGAQAPGKLDAAVDLMDEAAAAMEAAIM